MYDSPPERKPPGRLWIFLPVLIIGTVAGLIWDFSRPAIYAGSARLQIEAPPPDPDTEQSSDAAAQYLQVQAHALTGTELLDGVLEALRQKAPAAAAALPSAQALAAMLSVGPVARANVLELTAQSQQRELIKPVLDTWLAVYLQHNTETQREMTSNALADARDDVRDLEAKVAAKRRQLDLFRQKYNITSLEREENQSMAQLKGLNTAYNEARARELKAESQLATVKDNIAAGRAVIRSTDKQLIADREKQAAGLREKLRDLEQYYTPQFLELDPKARALRIELDRAEREISELRRGSESALVDETEEEFKSAKQTAIRAKQELDSRKVEAQTFSGRFAEHKALSEELSQLEAALVEANGRVAQFAPRRVSRNPRVTVLVQPAVADAPVSPDYLRDAGFAAGGALLAALLSVALVEFLRHKPREPAPAPQPIIQIAYPVLPHAPHSPYERAPVMTLQPGQAMLPGEAGPRLPRELSGPEVLALWSAATGQSRAAVVALLSGLSVGELAALTWGDIDFGHAHLQVTGDSPRTLPLTAPLRAALEGLRPQVAERNAAVLAHAGGGAFDADDIEGLIAVAANDAGLAAPAEVTGVTLRHTYLAYLVREGVRLGEIEKLVGRLPPALFTDYGRLSPPGPGLTLDRIDLILPVLRRI
ncbi:MAG TPA: tyrosine-type recombinase/integrase [Burkholderiales bacterium]|nr:tyrosine-type recombinase/integrase [Burkholderiales bacterium]